MSTLENTIANKAVLVTGANRGIGRALVDEALRKGAKRVYAGTRQPLAHPDGRVTTLRLDVTDDAHIQAAAQSIDALDSGPRAELAGWRGQSARTRERRDARGSGLTTTAHRRSTAAPSGSQS